MCKIDVVFCNSPDLADHIEQMILGLREAAPETDDEEGEWPDDDSDDDGAAVAGTPADVYGGYEEWGPDSAQGQLERGPR